MIINNGKKPTIGRFISCTKQADGSMDITVPAASVDEFKLMVRRAINTWPDKSYEMMDFADRVLGFIEVPVNAGIESNEIVQVSTPHGTINIVESPLLPPSAIVTQDQLIEAYKAYFGTKQE